MDKTKNKEELGRRTLWLAAVSDAGKLLEVAQRNKLESVQISKSGVTETNQTKWLDLLESDRACVSLAIISFCKLYNQGDGRTDAATPNSPRATKTQLDQLAVEAFPDTAEMKKFKELREELKYIRDNLLAHSSAEAHEVAHDQSGGIGSMNHGAGVWKDVDLGFFQHAMERLHHVLIRNLK